MRTELALIVMPRSRLDIHAVEHLRLHIAIGDGVRVLDQAISEGGFAVVDVGNDGEIADFGYVGHGVGYDTDLGAGQGIWGVAKGLPRNCPLF